MARTTPAFTDIYSDAYCDGYRYFHKEGAGAPRIARRPDKWGQLIEGLLLEESADNIARYSEDLDSWYKATVASIDSSNTAHPTSKKGSFFDGLIGTAATAEHWLRESFTASGTDRYVASVELKAGNQDWYLLQMYSATMSSVRCWANLSTGEKGTSNNKADWGLIPLGGGKYLGWVSPFINLYAENVFHYIFPVGGDGITTFLGDAATVNVWAKYVMVEKGSYPSSYIGPTTTATVTRASDDNIIYDYSNLLNKDSINFDFLKEVAPLIDTDIFTISDGTDDNKIYVYVDSNGYLNAEIISSGISQATVQITTDICTNEKKRIAVRWDNTLDILTYDYHTQEIETNSISILSFPQNLDTFTFHVFNGIIGKSKILGYYENNNKKLLFY